MKKLIIFAMLGLFVLSTGALATDTRVKTMGENNNVLLDEANIWLYPSRINDYPNLAVGEFGHDAYTGAFNNDFTRFGIHFKLGRDNPWILGGYFDDGPAVNPMDLFGSNLVPFDMALMDNRRINLFYGRGLGDLNFGMRLGLLHSSQSTDETTDESKESFGFYDFDFGLTADDGSWDIAANLGFGSFTDEDATGVAENEADGLFDLSVAGRMFYQVNPNYTLVPHAGIMYSKRGLKNFDDDGNVDNEDFSFSNKHTMFDLGLGVNYTPATNVLAVVDFGVAYSKLKSERDTTDTYDGGLASPAGEETFTTIVLPYFKIGLDADIFKWLDVRMGAVSFWNRETDEFEQLAPALSQKDKANYANNETYLGFGFHWGRFHVDTYTDPELFLEGFNFISGGNEDMNFQISAVYEMM